MRISDWSSDVCSSDLRAYACINPRGHAGYDEDCWGFSACEGPTDEVQAVDAEPRRLFGYAARGVPYGPDDGTLSPPAVLACLPFTPDLALDALGTMCRRHPEIVNEQRSEEHTSELQSLMRNSYAVFCLKKKKKNKWKQNMYYNHTNNTKHTKQ